jgi:methionine--tRNA ligase beta chain
MNTLLEESRPVKAQVKFDDFAKLDLRTARIVEAVEHPNADKLLILKVDLGGEVRQVCAPLKQHYKPEALIGKLVIVLANLEPRNMRGQVSQGMVLVANEGPGKQHVVILCPSQDVAPGSAVS